MNATQTKPTPAQAHQVLTLLAAHPSLKLNFEEHCTVQAALVVLKPAELTTDPNLATV